MTYARIDSTDHVATITIDPPGGQYDRAFLDALGAVAAEVAEDEGIRAVIIRADRMFGQGWAPDAGEAPAGLPGVPHVAAAIDAVAAIPQPVIAAIRGEAFSVGLELALACDIRLCAEGARFALPDTHRGAVPQAGGTQRLPRAIGRANALRMILLGDEIGSAEALRIGLVSRVEPDHELDATAQEIADHIAARGPIATRLAKEAVHRGVEMPLDQALRYELDLTILLQSTADRAEGIRAFVEKRPPRFIGR